MPVDREAVARALAEANARTGLFGAKPSAPDAERADGFYWVHAGTKPEIALWCRDAWFFAGDGAGYVDAAVAVLSLRLTPPGVGAPEPGPRLRVRWGVPIGDTPAGGAG